MVVLNWKGGLGNVTLEPGTSILVPFQTSLASLLPFPIPALSVAQPDEYGIYFLVESIDATTNAVTFKKDSDGFKIPLGYTSYQPTNTASTPPTVDDYLLAIGYPPGVLPGGTYSNALNLTTIRLGDGNDVFTLGGRGITQSLSAVVNKEASQGYIFQSNIFAGAGDDLVVALMPWQSVFKGGTNTTYRDAINDPSGSGVTITLDDSLTLEEVPFGDTIELKGSRFDWDIEFRDGDGDGSVTLASILDESDYIATSNNNRIFGFERILFGDILFDLVLYRQLESSVVYGQPDYFLTGSEPQAPELNSDIASGSNLWEAFRFNRTKIQGITGTATNATDVFTGNANDTPFLVGALQFASLNTEAGNDIVEIGSADQATIDLGSGNDQLKVNGTFSRASVLGGVGDDNIILSTVSNSSLFGGTGRDIVEVTTATTDTAFDGGGDGDTLLLPGTFASFGLTSSNTGGVVTFTDGAGNSFTGFQSIKFSDINLDALQTLSLTGPATAVEEGSAAIYTIGLSGSGLANGESVAFSLQLGNGTAQFSTDLAALILSSLQASAGIVLRNVSVDAGTGLIRAVATASRAFATAAPIATLTLPVTVDLLTEPDETFTVTLTDFVQSQTVTTTISNVLPVTIRLDGPATATEGSTASFAVVLDGVGLAAGRSVTFSLNSAGGTATQGSDFGALLATALQKADGLQLSGISTAADGTVTVTATNISGAALASGATLLTVHLPIITDATVEGNETFGVTLASSTAVVSSGVVTTTISDLVPTPTIALSGETSVVEGQSAAYAVSLAGSSLLAGQSVTFRLDSAGGTAIEGVDFAALVAAGITAGPGLSLSGISTDPVTRAITLTATNTSGGSLAAGSQLVSFSVATTADAVAEADEAFSVSLSSSNATVSSGAVASTITDNDPLSVRISGPATVAEGSTTSPYTVSLGSGVGLAAGRSVSFILDSASGSASEGIDFSGLLAGGITASTGISLSGISTAADGAITLIATNTSGADLSAGSALLSFGITTANDLTVEQDETFALTLAGAAGVGVDGPTSITTTITETGPTTAIKLTGSATVAEGDSARYAVSLDGVGLGTGRSVNIRLFTLSGTASQGTDYAALLAAGLTAAAGVTLSAISTDALGIVSVTATNSSGADLAVDAQLLSFALQTTTDSVAELNETYEVSLSSTDAAVGTASFTTTINDDDTVVLSLTGSATVTEGSAASYAVSIDGVGLGIGQSVTLRLDSARGTAIEGVDFDALVTTRISAGPGITLSGISTDPVTRAITLTATNSSGSALTIGSQLLTFAVAATADAAAEGNETYTVSLSSNMATVSPGTIFTSINNVGGLITTNMFAPQWSELNSGTTSFAGIAGTEVAPITINTGSGNDLVKLDDAIAFATVNTGSGNDSIDVIVSSSRDTLTRPYVQFGHGAYQAIIFAGDGNDRVNIQSAGNNGNIDYVRPDPQAPPEYNRPDYYQSIVDVGAGDDYVYGFLPYKTQFLGDAGVDTLFFYGRYSDWTYQTVDANGGGLDLTLSDNANDSTIWNASPNLSDTAIENRVQGFEFVQFNDINLDLNENLLLSATATAYAEGDTAKYTISLNGNGLQPGQSVAFTLQLSNGSAQFSSDLVPLALSSLQASAGIVLSNVIVDATTGLIRAVASSTAAFSTGSPIATLSLPIQTDLLVEANETFGVTLSGFVTPQTVTTTINDVPPISIILTGPAVVTEGQTATYTVALNGVGLAAGRSVTFSLNSAGGTATEDSDFGALLATALQKADGLQLSGISTAADGTVTVTATNISGAALVAGATLLTVQLPITTDATVEGNETFGVTLASNTAVVSSGVVTTTISDLVPTPTIALSGESTVVEGQSAAYAVSLAGSSLLAGQSVTFRLDSAGGTAIEGLDFAALVAAGITAGPGITLSGISTDPVTRAITLTATNSSGGSLAAGSQLVSFSVATTADAIAEADEAFSVSLSSSNATVSSGAGTIASTITDGNTAVVKLTGPAVVEEGSAALYAVSLDGVDLDNGQSVTLTLDLASGSATEGLDFAALLGADLKPAAGVTFSPIAFDPVSGALSLTVTNNSGGALASGSPLLTFTVGTIADGIVEANETFSVSLTSSDATVSTGTVPTTITETGATTAIKLTGSATVAEGDSASYAVSLDAVGLGAGRSVNIRLFSLSGTANQGADFAPLLAAGLTASAGVTLSGISTDALGIISVTATNSSGADLAINAELLSFLIRTNADAVAERDETYQVTLSSTDAAVGTASFTTTITDSTSTAIRLTGPTTVAEGSAAGYGVSLAGGAALGVGRSVTFTLDSAGITATEGRDFAALLAANIKPTAPGISLTGFTTGADGAVTLTATNTSLLDLEAGSQLLSFDLLTTADVIDEADETLIVSLTSSSPILGPDSITTSITDNDAAVIKLTAVAPPLITEGLSANYVVSLDGVVLGAGGSVTFTLDTSSGTAIEGIDFAALTPGALQPGPGLSLGGFITGPVTKSPPLLFVTDPITKAVTVTVTNTSGTDLAAGSPLLSFAVTSLTDSVVENSEYFGLSLTSSTATVSGEAFLASVIKDSRSGVQEPGAFDTIRSIDNVALGSNLFGFALQVGSGAPIQITYAGINASPTNPGAGWQAIAAAADGSGFDLFFKHSNGTFALWNLNGAGAFMSGRLLSLAEVLTAESRLGADLNGDQQAGFTFSPSRTIGGVALGTTQLGYGLQVGATPGARLAAGSPIQITYDGISASPTSPGAGWRAIAAAADGSGFDLFFRNTNGSYALWNLDGAGAFSSGQLLSSAELLAAESKHATDLNGDRQTGFTFNPSRTIGSVTFGSTQLGYGLKVGAGSPIQITYDGISASPTSPGAGWTAIGAAVDGSGFDLYFKNLNGSRALWNLDAAGAFTTGQLLTSAEFLAAESNLKTDLDDDKQTGFTFTPSRTIGTVTFGSTQLGYGLQVGAGSPIQITYAGINASPTSPGAGWTAIGAVADGSGFDLYLKNTNGSYGLWNLDATGVLTSGKILSTPELLQAEVANREDLSGDGRIGPFAFRGGGSQADVLTGLVGGATFGFAEADTLTSASPSASGFDILLGGSGNDAYQLPSGRSTLVIENGADPADSLTALGLSLHGATTKLTTLERGRHLVLSDTASNARLYLYDWRSSGNRIETFQFADGSFTFQQVQQKLTSLGASVTDTTWASWDSQFGNGQLTAAGFASGAAMDNLISFYRSVDASGVLA